MEVVPTLAVPSQVFTVILNNQQVEVTLRQFDSGLYMGLKSNGQEIVGLVLCENMNRIVRDLYLGFQGDFVFLDNWGNNGKPSESPVYSGLGDHFSLIYLSPDDLPSGVG